MKTKTNNSNLYVDDSGFVREKNMKRIPKVGERLHFFDDGKTSDFRHYIAEVLKVIPYNEEIIVNKFDHDLEQMVTTTLQLVHKNAVDDHRQLINFTVHTDGAGTNPGDPWLYAENTDYFIECKISEYDGNNIWFARSVDGGWFSMNIQNCWQTGELDVDGEKYQSMIGLGYEYSREL